MNTKIEKIQQCEINILEKIISICKDNNLVYYAGSGTVLGAVRHQGFIPWDDDIDIVMPRKDYNKFIDICLKMNLDNLFLQTYETDKEYYQHFAKMRDSDTTFIESKTKNLNINHGIFVDIFPLEEVHKLNIITKLRFKVALFLTKMNLLFRNPGAKFDGWKLLCFNFLFKPFKNNVLVELIEWLSNRDTNKKNNLYYFCLDDSVNDNMFFRKNVFSEGKTTSFGNIQIVIPMDSDYYLRCMYGDYMKLPPKEECTYTHSPIVFDDINGYKKYSNK
ncbi:MAG: LicD family protein [Erysipelotrichaceae bacterium]